MVEWRICSNPVCLGTALATFECTMTPSVRRFMSSAGGGFWKIPSGMMIPKVETTEQVGMKT